MRVAIMGHLAWTLQNATGNRGDDTRAILLCQLQYHQLLHPNNETVLEGAVIVAHEGKTMRKTMESVSISLRRIRLRFTRVIDCESFIFGAHCP